MTMDSVAIRSATPSDVDAIDEFLQPFVGKQLILPRTIEELRVLVQHGFVAEDRGIIMGFVAVEIYSRKMAEVQSLAVDVQYQGQGIGRRLVRHCVQRARDQGILELMAITLSDKLFRECGFDYSLPNQKRALFWHLQAEDD